MLKQTYPRQMFSYTPKQRKLLQAAAKKTCEEEASTASTSVAPYGSLKDRTITMCHLR